MHCGGGAFTPLPSPPPAQEVAGRGRQSPLTVQMTSNEHMAHSNTWRHMHGLTMEHNVALRTQAE